MFGGKTELEKCLGEGGIKWTPVCMGTPDPLLPSAMVSVNTGPATDQRVKY